MACANKIKVRFHVLLCLFCLCTFFAFGFVLHLLLLLHALVVVDDVFVLCKTFFFMGKISTKLKTLIVLNENSSLYECCVSAPM